MGISETETESHFIPIADCPKCGLKGTPLSQEHRVFKHRDTGKEIDLWLMSCPKCGWLANFDEESMSHVKGYMSIKDIEALGYIKDLKA